MGVSLPSLAIAPDRAPKRVIGRRDDFAVVDLDGQAEAVARHIDGWSPAEIAAWLGRYGEVRLDPLGLWPRVLAFRSSAGLTSCIWLVGEGAAGVGYHRRAACQVRDDE